MTGTPDILGSETPQEEQRVDTDRTTFENDAAVIYEGEGRVIPPRPAASIGNLGKTYIGGENPDAITYIDF